MSDALSDAHSGDVYHAPTVFCKVCKKIEEGLSSPCNKCINKAVKYAHSKSSLKRLLRNVSTYKKKFGKLQRDFERLETKLINEGIKRMKGSRK